jgi:Ca2+-binding EF-hand superfamily protein
MIRMFKPDGSGTIGFEEFCGLWSFLASWRTLFDRFDTDRSGNISLDEFTNALTAFGYRLSPEFVRFLFAQYDKHRSNQLSFDLFGQCITIPGSGYYRLWATLTHDTVQSCISLKRMTDVFKRYDDDRDGFIQLSFEDFLTEILRQR